jgi:hypothetical protein
VDKRSEDVMARMSEFLGVAKGLTIALTVLLTAIAGLVAALALVRLPRLASAFRRRSGRAE